MYLNLGSGRAVLLSEMVDELVGMCRVRVETRTDHALWRKADIPHQQADTRKFTALTGWRPRIPWHTTLRDTFEYWREKVREEIVRVLITASRGWRGASWPNTWSIITRTLKSSAHSAGGASSTTCRTCVGVVCSTCSTRASGSPIRSAWRASSNRVGNGHRLRAAGRQRRARRGAGGPTRSDFPPCRPELRADQLDGADATLTNNIVSELNIFEAVRRRAWIP